MTPLLEGVLSKLTRGAPAPDPRAAVPGITGDLALLARVTPGTVRLKADTTYE